MSQGSIAYWTEEAAINGQFTPPWMGHRWWCHQCGRYWISERRLRSCPVCDATPTGKLLTRLPAPVGELRLWEE